MTSTIRRHVFVAGPYRDALQRPICADCGSLQGKRVHQLPDRTDEERAEEARRTGER